MHGAICEMNLAIFFIVMDFFDRKKDFRNYNLEFSYSPSENEIVKSDLSDLIEDSFFFKPYDLSEETYCLSNKSEFNKIKITNNKVNIPQHKS